MSELVSSIKVYLFDYFPDFTNFIAFVIAVIFANTSIVAAATLSQDDVNEF